MFQALERRERQRLVRLVLEILHLPTDVVVPDQSQERGDRTVGPGRLATFRDGGYERFERERLGADRQQRYSHSLSISARVRPEVIQRSVAPAERQPVPDRAGDVGLRAAHGFSQR